MYNMGSNLQKSGFMSSRGETYNMSSTNAMHNNRNGLSNQISGRRQSHATRDLPLLHSIKKSADRYQSRTFKLPHQFQGDPYEKNDLEASVFQSYQQYHK